MPRKHIAIQIKFFNVLKYVEFIWYWASQIAFIYFNEAEEENVSYCFRSSEMQTELHTKIEFFNPLQSVTSDTAPHTFVDAAKEITRVARS